MQNRKEIENVMLDNKAMCSLMTGSGPTVFGLFENVEDAQKAENDTLKKMKRIGLVCDDIPVLEAMDSTLGGLYIPVSLKKDGSFSKNSEKSLVSSFEEKLGFYSCTVPTFEQYVIARLLQNGDFERHINKVRSPSS
mgnify:CR=1 FL=1